jgi:hypothetical protein
MKTKIFLSFQKLWTLIQDKPEKSALIIAVVISLPLAVLMTISLPDKSLFNLIFAPIFIMTCIGGLIWFGLVMIFSEKRSEELSRQAVKSGIQVMINQALIDNGSITKPEQMVKL